MVASCEMHVLRSCFAEDALSSAISNAVAEAITVRTADWCVGIAPLARPGCELSNASSSPEGRNLNEPAEAPLARPGCEVNDASSSPEERELNVPTGVSCWCSPPSS